MANKHKYAVIETLKTGLVTVYGPFKTLDIAQKWKNKQETFALERHFNWKYEVRVMVNPVELN